MLVCFTAERTWGRTLFIAWMFCLAFAALLTSYTIQYGYFTGLIECSLRTSRLINYTFNSRQGNIKIS